MTRGRKLFFFLGLFLLLSPSVRAEDRGLEFFVSVDSVAAYSASGLRERLKSHRVRFDDPMHGKPKTYRAFALHDVLELGFGAAWMSAEYGEATFAALDGYESYAEAELLRRDGGFIAFEDLDVPGWEPIGHKKADPAPYYLFWTGKEQSTANGYPWPWQLAAIHLMRFEERYPGVVPKGAAADSSARRGFTVFKQQCFRCHAMDQQGGKIGPDLNAPRNITTYRDAALLKEFIRAPSKFRHSNMPDHEHLSDGELDDLLDYLRFMGARR